MARHVDAERRQTPSPFWPHRLLDEGKGVSVLCWLLLLCLSNGSIEAQVAAGEFGQGGGCPVQPASDGGAGEEHRRGLPVVRPPRAVLLNATTEL